jgi:hypothetical protein
MTLVELDEQDIRREALQNRRKRLARSLRPPKGKAARRCERLGVQPRPCSGSLPSGVRGHRIEAAGVGLGPHADAQFVEGQKPGFRAAIS